VTGVYIDRHGRADWVWGRAACAWVVGDVSRRVHRTRCSA